MTILNENWLNRNRDAGVFALRLFIGIRLIYGVTDNVLSWDHMIAFRDFLAANAFPAPLVSAIVSVYMQLFAGIMIVIGFRIRIAAILMIINFMVAIIMVHRHDSFEGMTPALAMLFSNVLFLFYGSGRIAVQKD